MSYNTGIHLFDHDVTISDRGGIVLKRVQLSLPAESHPNFQQHLIDGLANLGIAVAQHHIIRYLRR